MNKLFSVLKTHAQALRAVWLCVFVLCSSAIHEAHANSPGKNGTVTITAANTIINQSSTLAIAAAAGSATLTVANITELSSPEPVGGGALAVGDVILIYQARGATINTVNSATYGDITSYGNAGNYEFQSVASVSGNAIGLAALASANSCTAGALKRNYSSGAQVIRVPQYAALTINAGASISSLAWNGSVGGVVAVRVQNTLTLNGAMSVSGLGFRGGILDGTDRASNGAANLAFASDANPAGGAKGEGIASAAGGTFGGVALPFSNPGGNFDIGAPANAGGGGGSHNGGGGGGANAASALTPYCTVGTSTYTSVPANPTTTVFEWCGQGVMPSTVTGAIAWTLDPAYRANGNELTAHVGGGRGGYTYAGNNADALTVGPGTTTWTGDRRHALGGWGGRPLAQDLPNRAFFGGGGGAGANNNGTGSSGGAGGGLIFIDAGALAGSGGIIASGITAGDTTGADNDAPGGGGAGGSIIVRAGSGSVGSMQAIGGNGGNQLITGNESEGPGGGGGGGLIAFSGGTQAANGGLGGTTTSPSLSEFPRNGATDASAGLTGQSAPQLIFPSIQCAALAITKTSTPTGTISAGSLITYTVVISNAGPAAADGSLLRDPVAAGLLCTAVSCVSATGTTCAASAPPASVTLANLQGSGIPISSFPSGSSLSFSVTCGVTATGQP